MNKFEFLTYMLKFFKSAECEKEENIRCFNSFEGKTYKSQKISFSINDKETITIEREIKNEY